MREEIYTVCYDSLSIYNNKKDAIKFYNDCYMMSEGAERERYASILFDLNNDKRKATDNISNYSREIYIHTRNYNERPLKVNLDKKLSLEECIKYYKNNLFPVLEICEEENIDFNKKIPFEDFGDDREINMRSITDFYKYLLSDKNVNLSNVYTKEVSDGKYMLIVEDNLEIDIRAWDDFDSVVNNVNTIYEYSKRKEQEKEYE